MSLIPYNSALTVRQDFLITPGVGTIFDTSASSSYPTDSGEAIGGNYAVTVVAGTITGSTVQLRATAESPTFPYDGIHTETVTFGVPTRTLVGGANLLVPGTGIASSWTATVALGDYLGAFNAGTAGYVEGPTRLAAKNVGTVDLMNCYARVDVPKVVMFRKAGGAAGGLAYIRPYTTGATDKHDPSSLEPQAYALTFLNLDTTPNPDEIDLKIDGSLISTLTRVSTGGTVDSQNLIRNGTEVYRIASGGLSGMEIVVNAAAVNTDTANIFVFDRAFIEIAPDISGAAGTYVTTQVQLTESGQPAGVITPSGAAYYWRRVSIPSGSSGWGPRPIDVAFDYAITAGIGWAA